MDPLHQFNIVPIIPIFIGTGNVSFTNSALFMMIAVGIAVFLMVFGMRKRALVPGRWQSVAELLYEFIVKLVRTNAGIDARPFVPFVFTLFMFLLLGNLLGMVPYSFTFTSHIIVTFAMGVTVITVVTIVGLVKHGFHFFSLFMPHGAPLLLAPLIIPLEIISYFMRPVSLSVRLFANMMAGHTMLKVFASFVIMLGAGLGGVGYVVGILPIMINVALVAFEFLVAIIQAFVFTLLTTIYLRDAIELH
ncbi:MAG: F0F1 ATP synthase subunit A [Azospirillum sp.]|nr:F0F1 ATP synthase subunit A [Azospirillum sp.]